MSGADDGAQTPTYAELRAAGASEFLTDGPNSGGVAGVLATEAMVWWFVADWTPQIMGRGTPAAAFVDRYRADRSRGIVDAVAWLVARGVGGPPDPDAQSGST